MAFQNAVTRLSELVADSIIGAVIATAASGARWVLGQGPNTYTPNIIYGYSGDPEETQPANIRTQTVVIVGPNNDSGELDLIAPEMNGGGTRGEIHLTNNGPAGNGNVLIFGDYVRIMGGAGASQVQVYHGDAGQCFLGGEAVVWGASPPAGTGKLILQATVVVQTNAGGDFNFPWLGTGFPNGIVSIVAMSGDGTAWAGNVSPSASPTGTLFNGRTRNPTVVSGFVRINYIAIGW